ncbi:MAG: hypothetical protein ACRD3T_11245 [Terriglobia bacterium]
MHRTFNRCLIASSAVIFFCGMAFGQQASSKDQPKAVAHDVSATASTQKTSGRKIAPKISLLDATRVSTAGALKAAAEAKTDATASSHKALEGLSDSKSTAAEAGVVELQPVASGSLAGDKPLVTPSKSSKGSLLKNVHGEVYGSTGAGVAGNNAEGGAVGATSKGGKTSIYVQTDHSQGTLPH